ncbi:hypothetical protein [Lentzea sp. NPDC092896]|uniref:hypothetical protein n=1 Tax=Lentzea sp. NPDC092896 TaxID=3364127 RepID=UPI00381E2047
MGLSVDPDDFTSLEQLTRWQQALDARGLRATGSPEHGSYVAELAARLAEAGVSQVRLEPVPVRRWTPTRWRLELLEAGRATAVPVAAYVPYSGWTGPGGVTGRLSDQPSAATIGLADVPLLPLTAGVFDALDYDAPAGPAGQDPATPYERIWLSQDVMRQELTRHREAGAHGLVLVVDLPTDEIADGYLLYDGVHRELPAVFVGREQGPVLREALAAGAEVRLVLEADVEQTVSHNIVGIIPGQTDELVVLQSHTDGTNGIEDNGPEAIIAMAEHLARRSRTDLPRGVLVLLSTGHFTTEQAWGLEHFLDQHRDDMVPRIAAALCVEHLGALPSKTDIDRGIPVGDHEFGAFFASPHRAVVDTVRNALQRAATTEARVLRPFVPDTSGRSPNGLTWPGDGCAFWHAAGLPSANFITGPDYLLDTGSVMGHIDVEALRRQAIAFTEAVLDLAGLPWADLHTRMDGASS